MLDRASQKKRFIKSECGVDFCICFQIKSNCKPPEKGNIKKTTRDSGSLMEWERKKSVNIRKIGAIDGIIAP